MNHKIAILSDIHGNATALEAVIADAKAQGVHVVLATGRPRSGVLRLLEELHLDQPGDLVITFNGALIQDAHTGETLYEVQSAQSASVY